MMDLTARQKFILNSIIEKGSLNIKDLSRQIDVSSRTVSREITAINNYLLDRNIVINENSSIVSIRGSEEDIRKLQQSLVGIPMQWLLSQDQKLLLITAQLLVAEEPYKSAYFSYQLNVVEGTITLYMEKIEQWLRVHNLILERKRGYGLVVTGSEWIKRNSFLELLYEYKTVDELLAFIYGGKSDPAINSFFKIIFDEDLIRITKEILELLKTEIKSLDDMAYLNSFIYILLAIKKTKLGSSISLPEYLVEDILSAEEFSFTSRIKEYLSLEKMHISKEELAYIAIQLMGNKYIYNSNRKFEELGVTLEELSSEVVYEVEKNFNINIQCDEQLLLGLTQHFNPALYRINMGIHVRNPLIKQIKEYYGDLFKAVDYSCKLVFSKYNIILPQDEIGYITMHIAASIERANTHLNRLSALVICSNGMGAAQILSNKLKQFIPQIGSITISSYKDWDESCDKYDIILSTTKINERLKGKNIIPVSPFLQQEDIERVNNYIKELASTAAAKHSFKTTVKEAAKDDSIEKYSLINNILENIQLELIEAKNFTELVSMITEDLYNKNLITDKKDIKDLIINREEMGSVVIPNCHVALLHTRSENVNFPFVGVYRIKGNMVLKSIGFADEKVDTFIVMLARKSEQSYSLEQMGKISIALIEDKKFTEVLRLGDIKDLRSSLITILNEELNN